MITGENFIGFDRSKEGTNKLHSVDVNTNIELNEEFYSATDNELNTAVTKAKMAFNSYSRISMERRAEFLEEIANEIEALGDELIQRASIESGLPNARFNGERGRTTGQLRLFAKVLREGSWVEASIDTAIPDRSPVPKPDIRKVLTATGPIAVFTASNFPLAFSTAGGDTASALAAGCPVIVKAHESHLGVNEMVSSAIVKAAKKTNMPDGVFSSLNGSGYETGQHLVMHKDIKGVAFTGSFRGGKALYDIAQNRETPIPVFSEMGSINPVLILPSKLNSDTAALSSMYAGSITMGVGQFCTNPGLLLGIKSEALSQFENELTCKLEEIDSYTMLNSGIAKNYTSMREKMLLEKGVSLMTANLDGSNPSLAKVEAKDFIKNPKLMEEVFGPYSLLVVCEDKYEMDAVIGSLGGQLTGTVLCDDQDISEFETTIRSLSEKVGRLVFNGAPTGVEVCHSMHHGGPFPASTDERFTSVGTSAILRFVRPICYQDMPQNLLPDSLKDENPLGIMRLINGLHSKDKIA